MQSVTVLLMGSAVAAVKQGDNTPGWFDTAKRMVRGPSESDT